MDIKRHADFSRSGAASLIIIRHSVRARKVPPWIVPSRSRGSKTWHWLALHDLFVPGVCVRTSARTRSSFVVALVSNDLQGPAAWKWKSYTLAELAPRRRRRRRRARFSSGPDRFSRYTPAYRTATSKTPRRVARGKCSGGPLRGERERPRERIRIL